MLQENKPSDNLAIHGTLYKQDKPASTSGHLSCDISSHKCTGIAKDLGTFWNVGFKEDCVMLFVIYRK